MDTVVLVGRLLVSLAVVLGVLWLVTRRMNRRGGRRRQSPIEILGRQQLGRHSAVAVVRVAEQTLVLGVTETAVSLLTTADFEDVDAVPAAAERPSRDAAHRSAELRLAPRAGHEDAGSTGSGTAVAAGQAPARSGSGPAQSGSALSGSVLSPGTWRQTVDALRDLTARSG